MFPYKGILPRTFCDCRLGCSNKLIMNPRIRKPLHMKPAMQRILQIPDLVFMLVKHIVDGEKKRLADTETLLLMMHGGETPVFNSQCRGGLDALLNIMYHEFQISSTLIRATHSSRMIAIGDMWRCSVGHDHLCTDRASGSTTPRLPPMGFASAELTPLRLVNPRSPSLCFLCLLCYILPLFRGSNLIGLVLVG